ncbi:MAG: hypothetical protein ACE5KE_02705, partial [Methanosarcinales archaeon]
MVWNKFFPSILIMNGNAIKFLENFKENKEPFKNLSGIRRSLRKLYRYKLLYEGDTDPYQNLFFKSVDEKFKKVNQNVTDKHKQPYSAFHIINDPCNLTCPY